MNSVASPQASGYRGRIAPSPTGYLHLGHARTFWTAQERAQAAGGVIVFRNEDLDQSRCRNEFVSAMFEDLRWFGLSWDEGSDIGGGFAPYTQSERRASYVGTFNALRRGGWIYPCRCSRRDVERALGAPHAGDEEPVYPGTCREDHSLVEQFADWNPGGIFPAPPARDPSRPQVSWRFRVPDGEAVSFLDGGTGAQSYVAGRDFGDFVVWRHDDVPAYQLAVVSDDIAMRITEIVRGRDLLMSTARQLLIYRALGADAPEFYHCPLMLDERGVRLAKRHDALSLRALREQGRTPYEIRALGSFGS